MPCDAAAALPLGRRRSRPHAGRTTCRPSANWPPSGRPDAARRPARRRCWPGLPPKPGSDFLRVAETLERFLLGPAVPLGPPPGPRPEALRPVGAMPSAKLLRRRGWTNCWPCWRIRPSRRPKPLFSERRPPGRAGGLLFRQTALEYLRLHPNFVIRQSWRERWRLIVLAAAFARGRGRVPHIHRLFSAQHLRAAPGAVGPSARRGPARRWRPILKRPPPRNNMPCSSRRHWSLVENFRALALSHAVALWLLRLSCGPRPPEVEDVCGWSGRSTAARPTPR